jgi:WD40 repeat protein
LRFVADPVIELAATPDASRLAVISAAVPGAADAAPELTVWDMDDWSMRDGPVTSRELFSPAPLLSAHLAFSPAGDRLVFPAAEGLAVLDLESGHIEPVPGTSGVDVDSVAWDGDVLRWVEHGTGDRLRLRTWDLATGTPSSIDLVSDALRSGARGSGWGSLSPGGRSVVVLFEQGGADLFAASTGGFRGTIPTDGVVGYSWDGAFLVAGTPDGLRVYSLSDLAPVGVPFVSSAGTAWADVGPGAHRAYVWSDLGTVTAFDVETGSQLLASSPDPEPVTAVATANETRGVIARGRELTVVDLARDARLEVPGVGSGSFDDRDSISHEESVATSGDGTTMAIWDFPQDGPQVVWSVRVMEIATGKVLADVRSDEQSGIHVVALSRDGRSLLTLHASGRLVETSIDDGTQRLLGTFEPGDLEERTGILIASRDHALALVEAQRTQILRADGGVQALDVGGVAADFLPDGSGLAIADGDAGLVRIVGLSTGDVATELKIDGRPMAVDVSGDGSRLLVGALRPDGTGSLELYALPGGAHLGAVSMTGPDSAIAVRFAARFEDAAGGTTAVSVTDRVRRWDVDPTSWRKRACELAGRNLTRAEWARFLGDEPYRQTCPAYPAAAAGTAESPSPGP